MDIVITVGIALAVALAGGLLRYRWRRTPLPGLDRPLRGLTAAQVVEAFPDGRWAEGKAFYMLTRRLGGRAVMCNVMFRDEAADSALVLIRDSHGVDEDLRLLRQGLEERLGGPGTPDASGQVTWRLDSADVVLWIHEGEGIRYAAAFVAPR